MFDHMGVVVADVVRSRAFYEACLAPLGMTVRRSGPSFAHFALPGDPAFFWIDAEHPDYWEPTHRPAGAPLHICFTAPSRSAVDAFHAAALAVGARDGGGPKAARGGAFYSAYAFDPDGNNIEAAFRERG